MINQPIMQVQNLRLKFPGESSLLFKDLSFAVSAGEKILLLGPSGCGKSTLLQVLSGLIPHSIEIPLKFDSIQLPDSWGFVFQDPDTQFCMPFVDEELAFVLENLQVSRGEMEARMGQALASVGLQIDDWHTPIQNLSQGMKQRLALASVLLLQPDVLFLDEPSALLDPEGTEQIWNSVKEAAASKTVIIVEHKIDHIASWVDRVVLFSPSGEIIADGRPDEIFVRHKQEIREYGIWYPDVWEDYIRSSNFMALMQLRQTEQENNDRSRQQPLVQLQNFTGFHGKTEKIVVSQADILPGEWITVVGENGAGKSTLLLSLMQLLQTTGLYVWQGNAVQWSKKKAELPEGLSLVFQNPEMQFVTNAVFDELSFSFQFEEKDEAHIREQVLQLMELFGLENHAHHHPYQLSMGQKRRLSVATALQQGHIILLLDEPTFGQDAKNTFIILEMLEQMRSHGTTIMMVTHDWQIVNHFATEVWTIDRGKLVERRTMARKEQDYAGMVHTR